MRKVVKFGGSSLASAEQFEKVGNIIRAEKSRRFVVPSAPGKRFSDDIKVTDMLYGCYALAEAGKDFKKELAAIKERYEGIIAGLKLELSLEEEFKQIEKDFKAKAGDNYAASRGEFLNGKIMAAYLGYTFVDPAECVFFKEDGEFDSEKTNEALAEKFRQVKNSGKSAACFLIGSSFGIDPRIKQMADFRLSFGPMTFPHHLMRVMALEQIYRAETIQAGTKYHK